MTNETPEAVTSAEGQEEGTQPKDRPRVEDMGQAPRRGASIDLSKWFSAWKRVRRPGRNNTEG